MANDMRETVCKDHPTYKGFRKPVKTKLHPNGCEKCWRIYQQARIREMQKKEDYLIISC